MVKAGADNQETKPLRHGYTTGACATAAAQAALEALIVQETVMKSTIRLPIGQDVTFDIVRCEFEQTRACAEVIKDGGDDPDATHGARIITEVSWTPEEGIDIDGGIGVGRVTKPGLPVDVGQAAINPVPRKMIREAVAAVLNRYEIHRGVRVVVSVPEGEEIAKKTLNARLGILGGISILGTRGIVVPFSTAAYKASVAQAIRVAVKSGVRHIVLSTGGRTEKFGMELYPALPEEAFVEMGDFVGFAVQQCARQGIRRITLVGMMGKFSKVAQGVMMVHSKSAPVDFGFLAGLAEQAGASGETLQQIREANTAAQVGDMMQALGNEAFFQRMGEYCCRALLKETGSRSRPADLRERQAEGEPDESLQIETVIISMKGELLGRSAATASHGPGEQSGSDRER
ncbi:cobalt-precorrin-5B (C(1))-methyltransferase [Paenibacillus validus]|uniref:Cobalt-precorrin-5B C(1)-methyltransferase n=1 Tax=Paenibacillus validus TaxID=44253 RepID=A0A7X2Z9P5_9BACL|nr:cobalt-precorrin-5B (C(1))-methyltransferase [Paenibacillus validus]MUG70909.1 cobalt-precorrin-5B (C(1))-methyltransferase [Paenibacillus validus]